MKKYYKVISGSYGKKTPTEIGYFLGWLLGKILLLGGGYCIGQVIRGVLRIFGIVLPSIF